MPIVLLFSLCSLSAMAVHRPWSSAAPAVAWVPPSKSRPPSRVSCGCPTAPSVTRTPRPPTKARSPSVMASQVMKTDQRKAACARTLRAARKSCWRKWWDYMLCSPSSSLLPKLLLCSFYTGEEFTKCSSWQTASSTAAVILEMLMFLMEAIQTNFQQASAVGSSSRAQQALNELHTQDKTVEMTDQLMVRRLWLCGIKHPLYSELKKLVKIKHYMSWNVSLQVPTLGSQEGAFENVRMNYSGDQGQTIRQLISAHVLRRVAMCVLSSPHGRRQHLAVSHEKGKVLFKVSSSSRSLFQRTFIMFYVNWAPFLFCLLDNRSAAFHPAETGWFQQEEADTDPTGLCSSPFHCFEPHWKPLQWRLPGCVRP